MWMLNTADDAGAPFRFRILPGGVKTIGRSTGADFIVEAPLVSRVHCRLEAGADRLEVIDLSSTNGTFVSERASSSAGRSRPATASGVGRVELLIQREVWNDDASERSERPRDGARRRSGARGSVESEAKPLSKRGWCDVPLCRWSSARRA